jgi:N-acetylmuramoyl-L-alanine amidase
MLSVCLMSLFFSASLAFAQPTIEVIYPQPNQRLGAVDSSFIFGNVTPGAKLLINGIEVPVHKQGGWLAYLSLKPGDFQFELTATLEGKSTQITLPVRVPTSYRPPTADSLEIVTGYRLPARNSGVMVGDWVEFSFRGTPDKYAYVGLSSDSLLTALREDVPAPQSYWGRALFGEGDIPDSLLVRGVYSGTLRAEKHHIAIATDIMFHLCRHPLTTLDHESPDFNYDYQSCDCVSDPHPVNFSVSDDRLFLVGELIDSVQTIRTGPRKGYLSIFQPQGLRFRITGYYHNYLRAELAPGQETWIPNSSIRLLPPGSRLPSGEVVLIRTHADDDETTVTLNVGGKLPFRVEENPLDNEVVLDVYNCTSNIDWIRYDTSDDLVRLIRWSQPQVGVMRLTINLSEPLWGYDCFYEDTQLKLRLKKAPKLYRDLRNLRIVIDPGHSPDPGAIGPTGYMEKDANLAIALELAEILRKRHAQVMLTRSDDSPIGIYERPEMAYRYQADIFISVHNNALPDGVNPFFNNGTSTYYYHPHSKALAESVQSELVSSLGLGDYGLYHANFAVARPTGYLAILVESAFMMIPEQEYLLQQPRFQKKVAKAIADGLLDFVRDERHARSD